MKMNSRMMQSDRSIDYTEATKMARISSDETRNGRLINGYDYDNQAWVKDGRYVRCGHPDSMDCGCYGRIHAGEPTADNPQPRSPYYTSAQFGK